MFVLFMRDPCKCSLFVLICSHTCVSCFTIQVFVKNAVNVVTGDVRVNGEVVQSSDKASHVVVKPKSDDDTEGCVIRFLNLTKGFSKEVKLTRGSVEA